MLDDEDWDELLTQDDGPGQPADRRSPNNANASRTLSGNKLFSDRLIFSRRNYNYNNYNTYITPGSSAPTYSSTSVNMNTGPSTPRRNNNNNLSAEDTLFDSTAPIPIQSEATNQSNTNQRQSPMSVLTIIRERSKSFSEALKDIFQKTPVTDRTAPHVPGVIASPAPGATSPRDILVAPTSLSTPLSSSQSSQPSETDQSPLSHYLHAPTTDDLLVRVPSWSICAGKSRARPRPRATTDLFLVCNELLKLPRSLPGCGHIFCGPCLEQVWTSGQAHSNYCPLCRDVMKFPKGGPKELPVNQEIVEVRFNCLQIAAMLLTRYVRIRPLKCCQSDVAGECDCARKWMRPRALTASNSTGPCLEVHRAWTREISFWI